MRHDIDAEKKIIGAALSDTRIIPECHVQPHDFHHPAHEELWALLVREERAGRPTDQVSINQRLIAEPIVGITPSYVVEIMAEVNTASVGPYFAQIVSALAQLRRLSVVGQQIAEAAESSAWDTAAQTVENARAKLDSETVRDDDTGIRTFADALKAAVDVWDAEPEPGNTTGWYDLDKILNGGWKPGQLTIFGARPAVGKSVVAGCAAVAAAEYGCGYFSLEMSELETVNRMAAAAQGIDLWRIQNHQMNDMDWQRTSKLIERSLTMNVLLDNRERISMAQVRSKVRSWKRKRPLKLVVIDYLQILRPADEKHDSRERQVNRLAEDCKLLAREFDIHVVALAQVNRGSTAREDKRPTMSDLRESGGIEAHADNIILLHRDDKEMPGQIEFNVEKNRHGRTGPLVMEWAPHISTIRNYAA